MAGTVTALFRNRWMFGMMSLLADGPSTPKELHAGFEASHARLKDLLGDRSVRLDQLYKPLRQFDSEGWITRSASVTAAFPQYAAYELTPMGDALLGSLAPLDAWCRNNYDYLVRATRVRYNVPDAAAPMPEPNVPDPDLAATLRARRGIGMALGLFQPRWAFGILAQTSEGPQRPKHLLAEFRRRLARNEMTVGSKAISPKVLYETLSWLQAAELIEKTELGTDPAGKQVVLYSVTPIAVGLLEALRGMGEFGLAFEPELIALLRSRRGLDDEPWPSASPRPGRQGATPVTDSEPAPKTLTFPLTPEGAYGAPSPMVELLRRECPVAHVQLPSGDTVAMVTKYIDVQAVHVGDGFTRNLAFDGAPRFSTEDPYADPDTLVNMDAPRHTRLREKVSGFFTPRRAEATRPTITTAAERLLDTITAAGNAAELLETYAYPLPIIVISEVLGLPAEDFTAVRRFSEAFLATTSLTTDARRTINKEFRLWAQARLDAARAEPTGGLVDELLAAADGGGMSADETLRMFISLLIAGFETTAAEIGRNVLTLLRHPETLGRLRAEPKMWPAAVQELMRFDTPGIGALLRVATRDIELPSGPKISAGTAVMAPIAAANHDPAQFPSPGTLDIGRRDGRSLAFGFGPHYCLGAPLATVELEVALKVLFDKIPTLRLAVRPEELKWTHGTRMRAVSALPVTW